MYLEGTVKDVDTIRYSSAESMRKRGVTVFPNTKVTQLDPENHQITVVDLEKQEERKESYDKLILGIGCAPNDAPFKGADLKNIYLFGGRDSAEILRYKAVTPSIEDVVIVGGGYIAVEAAMCFAKNGKKVTLLIRGDRPLSANLDKEFTDILVKEMEQNGIEVKTHTNVEAFEGKDGKVHAVRTDKGTLPAQLVITAIGNHPNTKWLEGILDMDKKGFVKVDDYMKSSVKDVFVVGGATLMKYNPAKDYRNIDLATNARKQGRIAAKNLEADTFPYPGTQGTSGLQVFDYYFASTGLNDTSADGTDLSWDSVYVETLALDAYLPKEMNDPVYAKLHYDKKTRRILGGQILSTRDLTGEMQALSMAIAGNLTIDDLAFGDFFFQPCFNRPWNILNVLGLEAQKKEA